MTDGTNAGEGNETGRDPLDIGPATWNRYGGTDTTCPVCRDRVGLERLGEHLARDHWEELVAFGEAGTGER